MAMADEVSSPPIAQSSPVHVHVQLPPSGSNPTEKMQNPRAEIDTSAPFESVKEAVTRFGGIGFWKPSHKLNDSQPTEQDYDESIAITIDEQTLLLEKDLIAREKETLDVLKELESTKNILEQLKLKLQMTEMAESEKENQNPTGPEFILMELKQAKLNLARTTTDLADIRTCVESYNKTIAAEKISLEKTRNGLVVNSSRMKTLEEELIRTTAANHHFRNNDLSNAVQQLNSEAEEYRKTGEAARSEVFVTLSEIEQTKAKIKTAKIRLVAAKKMKDAARAAEAVAMAEIKAISTTTTSESNSEVTLSYKEYLLLTSKARESEEVSRKKMADAMNVLDKENISQMEILKRVEEATEEVKSSKRVLEEALNRVEAANTAKFDIEESLKKWRSDHHNHNHKSVDGNGMMMNLVNDENRPIFRPTLSIGQILSRKLLLKEEYEKGYVKKKKVSFGQMLCKPATDNGIKKQQQQQLPTKRKKVSRFARFSILVSKQNKNKKKKKKTTSS